MSYVKRADNYDNTYLEFLSDPTIEELTDALNINKTKKALVIINVSRGIIDLYNRSFPDNESITYLGIQTATNHKYYFIRNESNCPELLDMKLYGAGVSILIKHDDKYYVLLHKDKTRHLLTCPGGTANRDEYESYLKSDDSTLEGLIQFHKKIAVREVLEETSTSNQKNDGIKIINSSKIIPILRTDFTTSLFEINDIHDSYIGFGYIFNEEDYVTNVEYLNRLFNETNKDGDHYTLKYDENSETEYIHAYQINRIEHIDISSESIGEIITILKTSMPSFKVYEGINVRTSILASVFSHINLMHANDISTNALIINDNEELIRIGLPIHTQSIEIYESK